MSSVARMPVTAAREVRPGMERHRETERALWDLHQLEPVEHMIDLGSPAVRLRVTEVGTGEPVLFIHGTGGPGTWPSLVRELPGVRCLLLDRPGWGESAPIAYRRGEYSTMVAQLLSGVLDALGLQRVHVAGASIGDTWALRLAQRHPSRVGRIVLLGGGPLVSDVSIPPFIRLLASPAGRILTRLSQKPDMIRAQLRQLGHGPALEDGRIPEEFIRWRVSLGADTRAMRHERDMVRAIVSVRGFRPGLVFDESELAAIEQPALMVLGTADPVGTPDIWKRAMGTLPRGELELVPDAGHTPWLDEPTAVGSRFRRFLGVR